jgi:hypothetical protein
MGAKSSAPPGRPLLHYVDGVPRRNADVICVHPRSGGAGAKAEDFVLRFSPLRTASHRFAPLRTASHRFAPLRGGLCSGGAGSFATASQMQR